MHVQCRLRRNRGQLVNDTRTSYRYLLGSLFCRQKSKFVKLKLKTLQGKLTPAMSLKKPIRQEKVFWYVGKSYDPNNLLLLLGPVQRNLTALYSHIRHSFR